MKSEIKKRWVDALRSGRYKQAREGLCKISEEGDSSYCCLGVLCDIYREDFPQAVWTITKSGLLGAEETEIRFLGQDSYLPTEVVEWAGLAKESSSDDPIVIMEGEEGKRMDSLSSLNDTGKSFDYIAALIEKTL